MAHWLAWKLGVISKGQAYELQGVKLSDPEKYGRMERNLGADRKSLERRFGKKFLNEFESIQSETLQLKFRTNKRTGKKYPVRTVRRGD